MSNEARDIRIAETVTTYTRIVEILGGGGMPMEAARPVAAQLTAIVVRENGENSRHNDLKETLYRLQNDLAHRVDSIRELADSIAGHVLDT